MENMTREQVFEQIKNTVTPEQWSAVVENHYAPLAAHEPKVLAHYSRNEREVATLLIVNGRAEIHLAYTGRRNVTAIRFDKKADAYVEFARAERESDAIRPYRLACSVR